MDTAPLLWGLLFGSFGAGYFIYGKKQKAAAPMACGIVLMVFPYFVSSTLLLVGIGAVLLVLPFVVKI